MIDKQVLATESANNNRASDEGLFTREDTDVQIQSKPLRYVKTPLKERGQTISAIRFSRQAGVKRLGKSKQQAMKELTVAADDEKKQASKPGRVRTGDGGRTE